MPDILIRGMDKPGSCHECDFCEVQDINFETLYFCNRNDRFLDDEEACNIPSDCPLYELPPHGDLIDRDSIPYTDTYTGMIAEMDQIDRLPVVIPSNKEESE